MGKLVSQYEIGGSTPRHPAALVMLASVAFGILCALLGGLLATPLAVVVMVLMRLLYVEDMLGKKGEAMAHGEDWGVKMQAHAVAGSAPDLW